MEITFLFKGKLKEKNIFCLEIKSKIIFKDANYHDGNIVHDEASFFVLQSVKCNTYHLLFFPFFSFLSPIFTLFLSFFSPLFVIVYVLHIFPDNFYYSTQFS